MKGEAFLLAAVVISVALVAMFQPMRSEYLIKQKQLLQSEYFSSIFENIFNEIKNSIYFSFDDLDAMIANYFDFLNFSKRIVNQKAMNFESLAILVKANTSGYLNITAINFFPESLWLNLTFNETQNSILQIDSYALNSTNFYFVVGNSHNLTIQYKNVLREITIETKDDRNVFLAYVDASINWKDGVKRKIEYFYMS
jgi:hypothetical protein